MHQVKRALELTYAAAVFCFGLFALIRWTNDSAVLELAVWAPAVGMLAVISGQMDLLAAIEAGRQINLKARALDFIHWLLLIGMNIGAWLVGSTNLLWFTLKIVLLGVIGWQIGVGIAHRSRLNIGEQTSGLIAIICAVVLGLGSGYIRALDQSAFGWGWATEAITATLATGIVLYWMKADLETMRDNPSGYPRSVFLKGLFSNGLVLWFWAHVMTTSSENVLDAWLTHLGLTVNVLVGNLVYFYYYGSYEYYRAARMPVV